MSTIKEILVKSFSENEEDLKVLDDMFNRMTGSYSAERIFICQDEDSVTYVYSGGDLQYSAEDCAWHNGSAVRTVLNAEGDYLKIPLASDFETSKVNVQELLALVRLVKAGGVIPPALFSTDMVDPPKVVSQGGSITTVQPTVVGVEVMRDRVLEIREQMKALKYESNTLIEMIKERGFVISDGHVALLDGKIGDKVRLLKRSNNTAMRIGKVGTITGVDADHYDIGDAFTVCKQDVELVEE